jgi:hypothetical protein
MPNKEGRTGSPGNSTTYHNIGIKTPKPSMLKNVGGGNLSHGQVFSGSVPGRSKKFTNKSHGTNSY